MRDEADATRALVPVAVRVVPGDVTHCGPGAGPRGERHVAEEGEAEGRRVARRQRSREGSWRRAIAASLPHRVPVARASGCEARRQ